MDFKSLLTSKIKGTLYGCAIGDALGLAGEFMFRDEVALRYPDGVNDYTDIYRDAHRAIYEPGEWTGDTEQILMMLEQGLSANRPLDNKLMAKILREWYAQEKGDVASQYRFIFNNPEFEEQPEAVAMNVWSRMGASHASNEAAQRAAIAAMFSTDPVGRAESVTRITHPSQVCIGSSAILGYTAHKLLWDNHIPTVEELIELADKYDERITPFIEWAAEPTLTSLNLGDADTHWYTRKTLASGLWGLWNGRTAKQAFDALLAEGGDTAVNAMIALAFIGLRDGVESLPEHLQNGLIGKDRLDKVADKLTNYCIDNTPELIARFRQSHGV